MARLLSSPRGRVALSLVLVLLGIAPMLSVALAGMIATLNGCGLHEGFVQPCIVLGVDIGGVLYTMGVLGWLMLGSVFLLGGGLLGLAGEAIRWLIRRSLR